MQLSSNLAEAVTDSNLALSVSGGRGSDQMTRNFAVLVTSEPSDKPKKTVTVITTSSENAPESTTELQSVSVITVADAGSAETSALIDQLTEAAANEGSMIATIVIDPQDAIEATEIEVTINSETGEQETIRIKVSDLQDFSFDDLSMAVIDAGADFRRQLFLLLSSALNYINANTVTAGVDKVTSVLLTARGLSVDTTGSINPENTEWGGEQTALATTYIGNVVPPDIAHILEALGASPEFIEGYSRKRNEIIAGLEQYQEDEVETGDYADPSHPVGEVEIQPVPVWIDFDTFDASNVKIAAAIFDTASRSIARALDQGLKEDQDLQREVQNEMLKVARR